ncbi:MAG: metabolite traffic protein EboE [Bacteroidetes bacterium]|nr:metabolite traffic protein EboE [Bacteroidota bacterium]
METSYGLLTYCTNIHAGETWKDHFTQLKEHIPFIKQKVAPYKSFGIGLRLSDMASRELTSGSNLTIFRQWLTENNAFVFTMNGFPYGSFHRTKVKDYVHTPDWLSNDRVQYTIRLAQLLAELLPAGIDGGISTSPLSYRFWHNQQYLEPVLKQATQNILVVLDMLIQIRQYTGKLIHIDIEPEPDGLLGDGTEFLNWYLQHLLPDGISYICQKFGCSKEEAESHIKMHIQLCYDICHFAVCYEDHESMIKKFQSHGIRTGKIQISAALKADIAADPADREPVLNAFRQFNESTYLHQVIAKYGNGELKRYPDMPDALQDADNPDVREWRAHYHVPVFLENYGILHATRKDIEKVLHIHCNNAFTHHLEIETYTWEVLPEAIRLPLSDSIVREIEWVNGLLKN